jgi:hypothetical protein
MHLKIIRSAHNYKIILTSQQTQTFLNEMKTQKATTTTKKEFYFKLSSDIKMQKQKR